MKRKYKNKSTRVIRIGKRISIIIEPKNTVIVRAYNPFDIDLSNVKRIPYDRRVL